MNPYLDTRYCDIRCTFQVIDLTARADAAPIAVSNAEISQINQTIDEVRKQSVKVATIEHNNWVLDGISKPYGDYTQLQTGWWSKESSDDAGTINTYIEFVFDKPHSSYGLSLYFDDKANVFPIKFKVTAYDANGTIIAEHTKTNSDNSIVIIAQMYNYYKIRITFTKMNLPNRRARLTDIVFGIVEEFNSDNTKNLSINREVDPASEAVPINEVDLTFNNSNGRYNMVSPDGAYKFLQTGMPLQVEVGVGPDRDSIEYEKMGVYYYVSSSSEDGSLTAKITAQGMLMYLDRVDFPVSTGTTTTLAAVVGAITAAVKQPIKFSVEPALQNIELKNFEEGTELKCRAALKEACFALRAICYEDKNGVITIRRAAESPAKDTLTLGNMATVPRISTKERINTAIVENKDILGKYEDIAENEIVQSKKINNSMITAALANDAAKWMLENTRDLIFEIEGRGSPLHELTDTISVRDAFGTQRNVVITKHVLKYDGGLSEDMRGIAKEDKAL